MTTKTEIHQFVQELLARNDDHHSLTEDESLILSGRLQSVDAVEIVLFLEERFEIDFAEIGFDREQIDSVNAIDALVETATTSSRGTRT
jgi:acyl carrier protein